MLVNSLAVDIGDSGVINHAGAARLPQLADRTGLACALSRASDRRRFVVRPRPERRPWNAR